MTGCHTKVVSQVHSVCSWSPDDYVYVGNIYIILSFILSVSFSLSVCVQCMLQL